MNRLLCAAVLFTGCVDTALPDLRRVDVMSATHARAHPLPRTPCEAPGRPCDDHDSCTIDDLCDGALICHGIRVDCDDGIECTTEICHPATGECEYDTWGCSCEGAESCDDGDPCTLDYCDFERTGCGHEVVAGEPCDDDDPCTEDSSCRGDGTCGQGHSTCLD